MENPKDARISAVYVLICAVVIICVFAYLTALAISKI
nr:MAG TPA: hypothetical protein [Crassvirales sp.]